MSNVNWQKWNRLRFYESVMCFFGFHEWYNSLNCPDSLVKYCGHCGKTRPTDTSSGGSK